MPGVSKQAGSNNMPSFKRNKEMKQEEQADYGYKNLAQSAFPKPSEAALAAYYAGGQFQSDAYSKMFDAYLLREEEENRQKEMTERLETLRLESENDQKIDYQEKQDAIGKLSKKQGTSRKVLYEPYSVVKRVKELQFENNTSKMTNINRHKLSLWDGTSLNTKCCQHPKEIDYEPIDSSPKFDAPMKHYFQF